MDKSFSNVLISRTDSIGDVILTLPMCAALKEKFPNIKIGFLGKAYTKPIIETCEYIDTFIDINDFLRSDVTINGEKPQVIIHVLPKPEIAKKAARLKIPLRIGTRNRLYHWLWCNKLVKLSRKKSDLHEAQLNITLLRPLGITKQYTLPEIGDMYGLARLNSLSEKFISLINRDKYNLILHPKSQGSAREWPILSYIELIRILDKSKFNVFISGVEKDRAALHELFSAVGDDVNDIVGKMELREFMAFINQCNGLLACSTGPLHIAAALGKDALGLYSPVRPVHPGRWAPLGGNAKVFVEKDPCGKCKDAEGCTCVAKITPIAIKEYLLLLL